MFLRLPPEIRVKIYEHVLINPGRDLDVNRLSRTPDQLRGDERQTFFTDILQVCRLIYREALPILYGKNMITFYERAPKTPLLSFPRAHLSMVKLVTVRMEPYLRSSTSKMALLLEYLAGAGVHLSGLFITIDIFQNGYLADGELEWGYPQPKYTNLFLLGEHPIATALSRLPSSVDTLEITMLEEARFAPGFAQSLVAQGDAAGHTVTIWSGCCNYHNVLFWKGRCRCFVCDAGVIDLSDREYLFPYEDDEVTDAIVDAWGKIEAPAPELSCGRRELKAWDRKNVYRKLSNTQDRHSCETST